MTPPTVSYPVLANRLKVVAAQLDQARHLLATAAQEAPITFPHGNAVDIALLDLETIADNLRQISSTLMTDLPHNG